MPRGNATFCVLLLSHIAFASGRVLHQGGPPPIPVASPYNILPPPNCNCTDVPPAGSGGCLNLDVSQRCSVENAASELCQISCARCPCCLSIAAMAQHANLTAFGEALHSLLLASEAQGNTGLVPPSLWSAFTFPGANKTVFVPTNAAFRSLAANMGLAWEEFLQQTHLLDQILQYSVLAGSIVATAEQLASGQLGSTVRTQLMPQLLTLTPTGNGGLSIGGIGSNATVVMPDSILQVVDAVLLPFHGGSSKI